MLWLILVALLLTWILHDVVQRKHAILRNFPIVGRRRLEVLGGSRPPDGVRRRRRRLHYDRWRRRRDGAGPLVFTDHVALPFKVGFARVYKLFLEHDLHQRIVFVGSGKLGFPEAALFAFALGCDVIAITRVVRRAEIERESIDVVARLGRVERGAVGWDRCRTLNLRSIARVWDYKTPRPPC